MHSWPEEKKERKLGIDGAIVAITSFRDGYSNFSWFATSEARFLRGQQWREIQKSKERQAAETEEAQSTGCIRPRNAIFPLICILVPCRNKSDDLPRRRKWTLRFSGGDYNSRLNYHSRGSDRESLRFRFSLFWLLVRLCAFSRHRDTIALFHVWYFESDKNFTEDSVFKKCWHEVTFIKCDICFVFL